MKKFIAFACVLAVCAGAAFAGGGAGDRGMRFGWWGNPLRNAMTAQVLDLFTQQHDIQMDEFQSPWGEYWGHMATQAMARTMPDVMQHDVSWILQHQTDGLLVNLTPFINNGTIRTQHIPDTVLAQGRIDGRVYAIPIGMNFSANVYNATLLESLGLSAPRHMTLDQFVAVSREVYQRTGVRTNIAFGDNPGNQLTAILRGRGISEMITPNGLGGAVADYLVFFQLIEQGIQEGWHIRPEHMAGREGVGQDPLIFPASMATRADANLRSWNAFVWSNMISALQDAAPAGTRLSMTTYPSANPQQSHFGRASMFLAITRDASNTANAAKFVDFWLNTPAVGAITRTERGIPSNTAVAGAIGPLLSPLEQMQIEYVNWSNQPGNSAPFSPLLPAGHAEVTAELRVVSEMVAAGQLTAQAAATRFFTNGNNFLRR